MSAGPSHPRPERSFSLLVNPASGGGAAPAVAVTTARLLRDGGADVEVTCSPTAAAVPELVAAAADRDRVVVAVGGDGMLSTVAGAVADADGTLGVLPAGRGNDFARMLGVPDGPAERARLLLEGTTRSVDLLQVGGGAVVAGSVYAGVDARAAAIVAGMRRTPARLQYPLAALAALATYRPASVRVVLDGVAHEFRAATVVVANSAYYGKGMRIAPRAVLDDGLLDVVVIEAASRLSLMRSLPKVYDGAHVGLPEVSVLRGARVELLELSGEPVPVGGDGEPLGVLPSVGAEPLTVAVRPGALSVLAPS